MATLTYIDGIPLYSTVSEALDWAKSNNIIGYHTHKYKNIIGYMGGNSHGNISSTTSTTSSINTTQQLTSTPTGGGGY